MTAAITIIGIGDDGLSGLSADVRRLIDEANVLVGGVRHQAMVPGSKAERITWTESIDTVAEKIARMPGKRVVVLATGDPMWFGAGANLSRLIDPQLLRVIPHPGAFSLAAARMIWPLADTELISIHGRPTALVSASLQPGARILALSRDGDTPSEVAELLTQRGYGPSRITVLEHLGSDRERRLDGLAKAWDHPRTADLNTLAIQCRIENGTPVMAAVPGLPDDAFESDGKMTKREVRAITISSLAPLPGQVLWEIGAGSGSVSIEWLRAVHGRRLSDGREAMAIALERNRNRCRYIARNAAALGISKLTIKQGTAPEDLPSINEKPDTVFVGGGVSENTILERCWSELKTGGRLVANAVTIDAWERLFEFHASYGGEISRIAVSRGDRVGTLRAFRPMMEVVHYCGIKP